MNTASSLYRELTGEETALLIARHFGGERFTSRPMSGGLFNTTCRVTLESGRELVLRAGPVNRHLLLPFEERLMESELLYFRLCRGHGIPCSEVAACETGETVIGRDYMFVEYIPSVPLSALEADEETKEALWYRVGQETRKLHAITGPAFGRLADAADGKGFERWSQFFRSETAQWREKALGAGICTAGEADAAMEPFARFAPLLDEITEPRLAHADLWAGNMLVTPDGSALAALIDGDRALFGDPEYDFSSPWIDSPAFFRRYGAGEPSPAVRKRRRIYQLLYRLTDSYVWLAEYNNPEESRANRDAALELAGRLLKEED